MPDTNQIIFSKAALITSVEDFFRNGQYRGVSDHVEELVSPYPNEHQARFEAGFQHYKISDRLRNRYGRNDPERQCALNRAFKHFKAASNMKPGHYLSAYRAGVIGNMTGHPHTRDYLLRTIGIDPDSGHAWCELGVFHENKAKRYEIGSPQHLAELSLAVTCYGNTLIRDGDDPKAQGRLVNLTRSIKRPKTFDFSPLMCD